MRDWIDEISDYIQEKEAIRLPLAELSEEIHQAALETDLLIEASNEIQTAIAAISGKSEHANS